MDVQKILPITFKSNNIKKSNSVKTSSKVQNPMQADDDVFQKQEGRIMRRAAAFSLIMLVGAIAFFRKKF